MSIDSIEYSIILRKRCWSKWKCRRETTSRDISIHRYFIATKWPSCCEALFCSQKCWFCENITSMEHILYIICHFCELIAVFRVESDIYREMKILFRATSEKRSEFFYILELSICIWIGCKSTFLIEIFFWLEFCETFSEILHNLLSISWIDKHRNIKFCIPVDKRGEPVSFEKVRISVSKECFTESIIYLYIMRAYFHHSRRNSIFYISQSFMIDTFSLLLYLLALLYHRLYWALYRETSFCYQEALDVWFFLEHLVFQKHLQWLDGRVFRGG
jgi:hypothetical protein